MHSSISHRGEIFSPLRITSFNQPTDADVTFIVHRGLIASVHPPVTVDGRLGRDGVIVVAVQPPDTKAHPSHDDDRSGVLLSIISFTDLGLRNPRRSQRDAVQCLSAVFGSMLVMFHPQSWPRNQNCPTQTDSFKAEQALGQNPSTEVMPRLLGGAKPTGNANATIRRNRLVLGPRLPYNNFLITILVRLQHAYKQ